MSCPLRLVRVSESTRVSLAANSVRSSRQGYANVGSASCFHICTAGCELLWRQIAQRTMWAHLVVIDPPAFDGLSGVVQGEEPVLIQALFAELAVEASM